MPFPRPAARRIAVTLIAASLVAAGCTTRPDNAGESGASGQSSQSRHYMAAAANPLAAEVGRDVLARGGNAIDAAVAMQIVLKLVEPQSSGIGGGAFLLYYTRERRP